jgi:hypothetical protein
MTERLVETVVNGLHGVNWPTKTVDLVSRGVDIPDPVIADAEEPFDSFSNRLPVVGHVVVLTVASLGGSVGSTTGAAVMVFWYRVRVTTVATGGSGGILSFRRMATRHGAARSRATVVVTVMATTTVSVGGMGPSVVAALGRRPVVTPGVGWVGSGYVVHWLAGEI